MLYKHFYQWVIKFRMKPTAYKCGRKEFTMENSTTIICHNCGNTLDVRVNYVYPTNFYDEKGKISEVAYSVHCDKCGKYTKASKEFVEANSRK